MIVKIKETKNGYLLDDLTTNEEFVKILKSYKKVNCILCNEKTASVIRIKFLTKIWFNKPSITIRKNLSYGEFYINGYF